MRKALIWLEVWVRAFTALRRVSISCRTSPTKPRRSLGLAVALACQHGPGGVRGVDRVAFALAAPARPVWAVDLPDLQAVVRQVVGYYRYDIPATPFRRILASGVLTKQQQRHLSACYH